jgi:hypothetical protein
VDTERTILTFAATLVFCWSFLHGRTLGLLNQFGRRTAVSTAGGAAAAYVFVHLLPEIEQAAELLREETDQREGGLLYFMVHMATMAGFVMFYGLEKLVIHSKSKQGPATQVEAKGTPHLFAIHITVFFAYAWMVGYLLVRPLETSAIPLGFYAAAMAFHFLSVAYGLRREHGERYRSTGARWLAAGALLGWGSGLLVEIPGVALSTLLGLLAGGIIANTMISELPTEKEGKFIPFLVGAVTYTALLILAV